jgi:hypothetical protein
MLDKILPRSLDNDYRGYRIALWLLGIVLAVRAFQSVMIIFNGYNTVVGADGIPLDTYAPDAAQNVLALFAMTSLWRLVISLLGLVVLLRYRSAVPLMFAFLLIHFVAVQILTRFLPLVRVGNPPGTTVNLVISGLLVVGFAMSLMPRRGTASQ